MLSGVRRWLDTSGRALELRVARTFRREGAKPVSQTFRYLDPTTGVLREGDVLAEFGWKGRQEVPCSITAVVECKSSKQAPWVAFYDRQMARATQLEDWVYFMHGPFQGITQPLPRIWVGHAPFDTQQVATHIVAAHAGDKSLDQASDAVRQVLSAAESERERYVTRQGRDPKRGLVVLPVIVTAAPLVKCRLDNDGEVELEQVESLVVTGHSNNGQVKRTYVLNESQVCTFAHSLKVLAKAAGDEAEFHRSR